MHFWGRARAAAALLLMTATLSAVVPAAASSVAIPAALPSDAPPPGGGYVPLAPVRIADTRSGGGPTGNLTVPVVGVGGVPATGVSEVVLNVTAISSGAGGWVVAYASSDQMPSTSNINVPTGSVTPVASMVVVSTGAHGAITLYASSAMTLIVDVMGYFTTVQTAQTAATFDPVTPLRLLDTRSPGHQAVGGGTTITVPVAGVGDVPPTATAVVLNTTVTAPVAGGWVTDFPAGGLTPATSTINFGPGQTVAEPSHHHPWPGRRLVLRRSDDASDRGRHRVLRELRHRKLLRARLTPARCRHTGPPV